MKEHSSVDLVVSSLTFLTSWGAALCVVGIVGFTAVEILGRWVLGFTTKGSEELTGFMMVGVTYLGLAHTFVKGEHIAVDMIFRKLKHRSQRILAIIFGFMGVCFCTIITYLGILLFTQNLAFGSASGSTWAIPMAIPTIFVPIGTGHLGLVMLLYTVRLIRSNEIPKV